MTQPDMSQLIAQAQEMQAQLAEAQTKIIESVVTGEAGNGLVKITVKGSGAVQSVAIDPEVVDPEDVDTLQDLIVGAFADATAKIADLAQQYMGPLQTSMGDNGFGDLIGS